MKQLLMLMLLAPMLAHSATIAFNNISERHTVVLTDEKCSGTGHSKRAYMAIVAINTLFGCWYQDDFMIHVSWDHGEIHSYPMNAFQFKTTKSKLVE